LKEGKYQLITAEVAHDIENIFYNLEGDEEISKKDF